MANNPDKADKMCRDVYKRQVYKGAFTHQITRSMIVGQAGAQFDPDVVDAFVHNEAQFLAIRSQFTDAQALAA